LLNLGGRRRPVVALFPLALLAGLAVIAYWGLAPYPVTPEQGTFVEIARGMSSREIAAVLASHGVIRSKWIFLGLRAVHPRSKLQAGEYRFAGEQSPWRVFDKIRRGDVFYEEFTVPEGSNIFDIAALLEQSDTVKPNDFLNAAADASGIRDLDAKAPNLEGYLFPSTYRVTHSTTARQLCRMMTDEFRKQWRGLVGSMQTASAHRVVTLASMVEKETAIPQERPLVASVFANRLQMGMPLQCDPTTVYAALLEDRYRGGIHKSDLKSANPYNTYTHAGLPPGPIANPGTESLKAALQPATGDYLYFVARADGSGRHHFSATLAEHERAVAELRKAGR